MAILELVAELVKIEDAAGHQYLAKVLGVIMIQVRYFDVSSINVYTLKLSKSAFLQLHCSPDISEGNKILQKLTI